MFFLKKKCFNKFKQRYKSVNIVFVRPELDYIPDNKDFYIQINGQRYSYSRANNNYTLKTNTYIDRPLTLGKLVDLLEEGSSNAGPGFQARLSLIKSDSTSGEIVGYIFFKIINDNGYIRLNSIQYGNYSGSKYDCFIKIDENSNIPNIFFGKDTDYTGDITNILMTEDYFNGKKTIQLAIANLNLSCPSIV